MFTWICPQCGREVPPSYNECPDCTAREKGPAAATAAEQPPAAPPPAPAPAAVPTAPAAPATSRPAPPRRGGLPTWLMSLLFALAFIGIGLGVYWLIGYLRNRDRAQAQPAIAFETPTAKGKAAPNPVQKYIEVTGVRFIQNAKKQTEVRFLVVNHSPDLISDLAGTVVIWGRTQKSDEESVGSFAFKLPMLGPWESRELSAPVNTKLRVYELPDWQNVTAELQLNNP
jgi:hypothetical protein